MSLWIKQEKTYYYVNYDESEKLREKYVYYKSRLYDDTIAFTFVPQPKRVFNSDYMVEQMMSQLSIDDEVKDIVKRDFKIIPLDHLQFLIDNDIKIVKSLDETYYDGNNKIIGINKQKPKEGMVAHELGHAFVDINNLYENCELKTIMQDILENSLKVSSNYINNDMYTYVESDKFIRKYQGRTYILYKEYLDKKVKLEFDMLEEYVSVGYETFVINPKLLYTKDKDLYDFFEKGGLKNENV
ncbi:MAG: hypothetical protein LUG60_03855 [Erysipelotrichaceae bacterium]|nr:hypothetical protein [Erysipelotrichaceae bacterium]